MNAALIVSELELRLGRSIEDPAAVARAIELMRQDVHLAPCSWSLVESILLAIGRRGARRRHESATTLAVVS